MGYTVLVNPNFVLIGDEPCGVSVDGLARDEEGGWCGLVPDFDAQFVAAFRNAVGVGWLQLTVDGEVILAFGFDTDDFILF